MPSRPRDATPTAAAAGADAGSVPASARDDFVRSAVSYLTGEVVADGVLRANTTRRGGATLRETGRPTASALGIRMVADLTGRSHAAPLFHFPDRTTLVAAVAAEGFRRLVRALGEVTRRRSGAARLREIMMRYAGWAGEVPALFATMYDPELAPGLELLMLTPHDADALEALAERHGDDVKAARRRLVAFRELLAAKQATLALFIDAVSTGIDDGSLRGDHAPVVIAHAAASVADGLAWQRVTEPQGSTALMDRHASMTVRLLFEGIETPTK